MQQIKVTKEWAADHLACRRAVQRFFEHWPRGLTLNRRNLYMAADQLPISDILWFAGCLRMAESLTYGQYEGLHELAEGPSGRFVRSPAKKRAVAKAFADLLGL